MPGRAVASWTAGAFRKHAPAGDERQQDRQHHAEDRLAVARRENCWTNDGPSLEQVKTTACPAELGFRRSAGRFEAAVRWTGHESNHRNNDLISIPLSGSAKKPPPHSPPHYRKSNRRSVLRLGVGSLKNTRSAERIGDAIPALQSDGDARITPIALTDRAAFALSFGCLA